MDLSHYDSVTSFIENEKRALAEAAMEEKVDQVSDETCAPVSQERVRPIANKPMQSMLHKRNSKKNSCNLS